MLTNTRTADLQDAQAPDDVPQILRNAAERYRESVGELQAAWQDKNAGAVWNRVAKALEATASRIEKIAASA